METKSYSKLMLAGEDLVSAVYEAVVSKYNGKRIKFRNSAQAIISDSSGEYERQPAEVSSYSETNLISYNKRTWAVSLGRGYNNWWPTGKKYRADILALDFEKPPAEGELVRAIESSNRCYEHSILLGAEGKVIIPHGRFFRIDELLKEHFFVGSAEMGEALLLPKMRGVDLYEERFVEIFANAVKQTLENPPPERPQWLYSIAKTEVERDRIMKEHLETLRLKR